MRKIIFILIMLLSFRAFAAEQEFVSDESSPEIQTAVVNEEIRKINREMQDVIKENDDATLSSANVSGAGTFDSLVVGAATGGNQGSGTINASGIYDDGVLLQSGKLKQVKASIISSTNQVTDNVPSDNTKPQIDEGEEVFAVSITPEEDDSTLYILVSVQGGDVTSGAICVAHIHKDDGDDALAVGVNIQTSGAGPNPISFMYKETSGSTDEREYEVLVGCDTGNYELNQRVSGSSFGGIIFSGIIILEVSA